MIKIIFYIQLVLISVNIFSCSKDDTITNSNNNGGVSGSFSGEWTLDKVQMVQAPTGISVASVMKQALVPFGEVDASFVGYLDFTFGAEAMSTKNMNAALSSSDLIFSGNKGYTLSNSILKITSDGGITWNAFTVPINSSAGFVYDENTIYLTSNNFSGTNYLIKSINSGVSWDTISSSSQMRIQSSEWNSRLYFVNSLVGYAISDYQNLYKTTNGGVNWTNIFTWNSSYDMKSMKFFDEMNGVVLDNNSCKKTTNGGINWNTYPIISSGYIYSWYFLNSNTGWATGYSGSEELFLKTNNGGLTWSKISDFNFNNKFVFANENVGYGMDGEFLLKTTNSGVNWQNKFAMPPSLYIQKLNLINGEPALFTYNQVVKPSGFTDTTKWIATGRISNSAIKVITKAPNSDMYANGESTLNSGNIIFSSYNYSGTPDIAVGVGAYSFESGFLNIILNLPNDEKWKIKLSRK